MNTKIKQLKKLMCSNRPEDIFECEDILAELLLHKSETLLKELLLTCPDKCGDSDIMYLLIHGIESFPLEQYIDAVSKSINMLSENSLAFLTSLLRGIFNDELSRKIFEKNLHFVGREEMTKVLDHMEKESAHHNVLIQQLRNKISENSL